MRRPLWILTALAMTTGPALAELYRWVDENGRVHYGDRIPPKYAKTEREVLDESGLVRETLKRELTDEERAAIREREQQEKLKAKQAEEQKNYDKFLLSTYESPGALVAARDYRLETMDGQIRATEKSVSDTERILGELRERERGHQERNQPIPAKLEQQLAEWDRALVKALSALQRLKEDRAAAAAQFERDLNRYLELRGLRLATPAKDGAG